MTPFWLNSKEKIIAAEEGEIGGTFIIVQKNGPCEKLMQIIKFASILGVFLLLGLACYTLYKTKNYTLLNIEVDHPELITESPNKSDFIKWQEKLSEDKTFDPLSSSEPWPAKTQIISNPDSSSTERDLELLNTQDSIHHSRLSPILSVTSSSGIKVDLSKKSSETVKDFDKKEIEDIDEKKIVTESSQRDEIKKLFDTNEYFNNKEEQDDKIATSTQENIKETINNKVEYGNKFPIPKFIQMLHDLDKTEAETKDKNSSDDLEPSSEGILNNYYFEIALAQKTGIEVNNLDDNDSKAVSEESQILPFFYHLSFSIQNRVENTSELENIESSLDSVSLPNQSQSVLSDVDPGFYKFHWDLEDISQDEDEFLEWWVNTPEFQGEKEEEDSSSEEQSQFENKNSAILSGIESPDDTIFDLIFGKKNSQEIIIPESEEVKNDESINVEFKPESEEKAIFDFIFGKPNSQNLILPQPEDVEKSIDAVGPESMDKAISDFVASILSSELEDQFSSENQEIIDSEKENYLYQKNNMILNEETVSEEEPVSNDSH